MNQAEDKFEIHYRQQLSAMIDGDLAPDEARFLLRRLQHDSELNGCWERWQLCGDVLRGHAQAPAPVGFADRVAAAIAGEAQPAASVTAASAQARPRRLLAKWAGGALAASVALVALFMARQNVPNETPDAGLLASQQQTQPAAPAETEASDAMATAPAAVVAAAAVQRKANRSANRGSATRNQQVARANARRSTPLQRVTGTAPAPTVLASAAPAPSSADAFRPVIAGNGEPAAKPWPRSTLSGYPTASGAFNASFGNERSRQSFHPFEPQLQQAPPIPVPASP